MGVCVRLQPIQSRTLSNPLTLITEYLFIFRHCREWCVAGHDHARSAKTKVIIGVVSVFDCKLTGFGPTAQAHKWDLSLKQNIRLRS